MRSLTKLLGHELLGVNRQWLVALASSLAASNLIANTFVVERVFSPDANLLPDTERLIVMYNVASLAASLAIAVCAWRLVRFHLPIRVYHAVLLAAFAEAFLRVNMFTDILRSGWLRNPRIYATGVCGDNDYYVLAHYYAGSPPTTPVDPQLGWTAGSGPMKIIGGGFSDPAEVGSRPILFFGDSFVAQGGGEGYKVPEILQRGLSDRDVLNFGVPGYATDQIALRFRLVYPRFANKRPTVLIGTMLDDLDRSLLQYRQAQKPFYELTEDGAELRYPRFATNREYFDQYDFHQKCFALAPLLTLGAKLLGSEAWCTQRRLAVNRAVFGDMLEFARLHDVDIHIVVMYNQNDLNRVSPMERELATILDELEFDRVIDTKPLLLAEMEQAGVRLIDLYDKGSHHTARANLAIARGIEEYLRAPGLE